MGSETDLEQIISLTSEALKQIKAACDDEKVSYKLRIFVQGGGCAGYRYGIDFEDQFKAEKARNLSAEANKKLLQEYEQHLQFEEAGVEIYIDPMSAMHLEGVTLDYRSELMGSGFKFINPSAKTTCGCGSSFG